MSPQPEVSSWVESDGVEVWLVAGSGRGHVADLAEAERVALSAARRGAVLAANADADDAKRVAQLLSHGYGRVFSMVELERDTSPLTPSPVSPLVALAPARVCDAVDMHHLTRVVWADLAFFSMPTLESYQEWLGSADLRGTHAEADRCSYALSTG